MYQQANRILAAATKQGGAPVIVPTSLRGVRASYFVWGLYGRDGGAVSPAPKGSLLQFQETIGTDVTHLVASSLDFQDTPDETTSKILVSSQRQWQVLIDLLSADPRLMMELAPRRFEELVAELLTRDGLDVELTPERKDGGRDVLAYMDTEFGRHLYLVECKRYSSDRPVGVEIVRALYGVVEHERATAGLLITTSRFTAPAVDFQTTIKNRMTLKEYTHLCDWLKRHSKHASR